jgi:hypothetical protein
VCSTHENFVKGSSLRRPWAILLTLASNLRQAAGVSCPRWS